MTHFPKKRPNFWMEGPGAKKFKNVWFRSGWPCAMGFQDSVTFCSYGLFFSMNVIFEIIEIYRVDFVLCCPAPVPRLVRGSITELRLLRCREKEEFVCRKQRVKEVGERKKDDVWPS